MQMSKKHGLLTRMSLFNLTIKRYKTMSKKYLILFSTGGERVQSEVFTGDKTLKEAMRISAKYPNHSFVKAR